MGKFCKGGFLKCKDENFTYHPLFKFLVLFFVPTPCSLCKAPFSLLGKILVYKQWAIMVWAHPVIGGMLMSIGENLPNGVFFKF